jgi:hypothetical protein
MDNLACLRACSVHHMAADMAHCRMPSSPGGTYLEGCVIIAAVLFVTLADPWYVCPAQHLHTVPA